MKILLRLPTWLGDGVMATPTLEALKTHYPQAEFTLVGSPASVGLFQRDKDITTTYIDSSKESNNRLKALYKLAKEIGKHDIAITFQNNLPSALLLFLTKSKIRIGYQGNFRSILLTHALKPQKHLHQVYQYLNLLSPLQISVSNPKLSLYAKPDKRGKRVRIGISPGAKYGSAKRWCEAYFIEVIATLLQKGYEVLLYGGKDEIEGNTRIIKALQSISPLTNLHNLTNQTSISELIDSISSLDLFLTNDSGAMHIASSQNIPLIALFGPTDCTETSPFNTQNKQIILNKHLSCSPCKKRECPLQHHNCMKLITPDEVLNQIFGLCSELSLGSDEYVE